MAKNKPGIRFHGFNDEWEQINITGNVSFSKGRGYSKSSVLPHGTPLLLYGSLYTDYKTNINSTNSFAKIQDWSVVSSGHEVVVPASGETAEDIARATAILAPGIILGGDLNIITPNENINPSFLALEFTHGRSHNKLVNKAQGISVVHLHNDDIAELDILLPEIKEQEKIGKFFEQFDELINAKEQELEKLRQLKLALLDGMFPGDNQEKSNGGGKSLIYSILNKNNEFVLSEMPNTPAIRFRGFTEPWCQATFGDYGYICMCKRVMKHQTTTKGDVPFFKIGTFGGSPDAYISRDLFLSLSHNYSYPRKGDILISAAGTLGRTVEFTGEEQYFQDSNIVWLNHSGKLYNPFLKVLYSIVKWTSVEGSTLKRLYNNNILNTQILVPQFDEQRKIGDFFRQQDETIANAQMQILKLRNIKQACMDKMFA